LTRRASPLAGRSFPWEGIDEDRRGAILLYGLIALVVIFAAALIGWGYYKDKIAPKHATVLTVGSRKFDLSFLERRVRLNLNTGKAPPNATLQDLVVATLQAIEVEEETRVAGKEAGVSPSDADIDNGIRAKLGLPDGVARDIFAAKYREDVLQCTTPSSCFGLPVSEYREIIAAQIVEQRLESQYKASLPDELEQVDASIIRTADEATAKQAKQRLDGGQTFDLTAAALSTDPSKNSGGKLGWIAKAELPPKAADTLFSLPFGQASDPIQDLDGWYIVLAAAKEVRSVTPDHKTAIAKDMFNITVNDTRTRIGTTNHLTQDQVAEIGRHILGQ
jgi:PPIC-type peptidyl-prolyl cis-trans isomerase-like protein